MVHILNGEIVSDNDPRVRARQQPPPQTPRRFGSVGPLATAGAARPGTGASPLHGLIRQMGLEGSVTIPAILGLPARAVEKIHLVVAALLAVFFGWWALAFLVFVFFLTTQQAAPSQR